MFSNTRAERRRLSWMLSSRWPETLRFTVHSVPSARSTGASAVSASSSQRRRRRTSEAHGDDSVAPAGDLDLAALLAMGGMPEVEPVAAGRELRQLEHAGPIGTRVEAVGQNDHIGRHPGV